METLAGYVIGGELFSICFNPLGWLEFRCGDAIMGMSGPYCRQTAKQSLESHLDVLAGLVKRYFNGN
jgi:hypothetical protein